MLSFLRLECKQKNSSKPFRIRIFLLLSYSFRIETINMLIHSHCSFENHTRFQNKMDKVYTRFHTKTAQKPYPMGWHISGWHLSGWKRTWKNSGLTGNRTLVFAIDLSRSRLQDSSRDRSNDGDGNQNVTKAIGLITKTTTLHMHHSFLYIFCRYCTTTTWNA